MRRDSWTVLRYLARTDRPDREVFRMSISFLCYTSLSGQSVRTINLNPGPFSDIWSGQTVRTERYEERVQAILLYIPVRRVRPGHQSEIWTILRYLARTDRPDREVFIK